MAAAVPPCGLGDPDDPIWTQGASSGGIPEIDAVDGMQPMPGGNVRFYDGNYTIQLTVPPTGAFPLPICWGNDPSRGSIVGIMGPTWWMNLEHLCEQKPNGNVIITRVGRVSHTYTPSGGSYVAPGGTNNALVKNGDNTFTETARDKTRFHYGTDLPPC